jgi:hypothetical protein
MRSLHRYMKYTYNRDVMFVRTTACFNLIVSWHISMEVNKEWGSLSTHVVYGNKFIVRAGPLYPLFYMKLK